jgi:hypothetical protein
MYPPDDPEPCVVLGCHPDAPSSLCITHSTLTRIPCDFRDPHTPHRHGGPTYDTYLCVGH